MKLFSVFSVLNALPLVQKLRERGTKRKIDSIAGLKKGKKQKTAPTTIRRRDAEKV